MRTTMGVQCRVRTSQILSILWRLKRGLAVGIVVLPVVANVHVGSAHEDVAPAEHDGREGDVQEVAPVCVMEAFDPSWISVDWVRDGAGQVQPTLEVGSSVYYDVEYWTISRLTFNGLGVEWIDGPSTTADGHAAELNILMSDHVVEFDSRQVEVISDLRVKVVATDVTTGVTVARVQAPVVHVIFDERTGDPTLMDAEEAELTMVAGIQPGNVDLVFERVGYDPRTMLHDEPVALVRMQEIALGP
ncbi:hypothetical protein L6R50_11625 [Myxococcota bacterium]|nr:hypothetical protein [Myxococcota bacterium]